MFSTRSVFSLGALFLAAGFLATAAGAVSFWGSAVGAFSAFTAVSF